jgi:hypothetical protein
MQQGARRGCRPRLEFRLGSVTGGNLVLSNVELTGNSRTSSSFSAATGRAHQTTSVANEMLQQLLSMQDRR